MVRMPTPTRLLPRGMVVAVALCICYLLLAGAFTSVYVRDATYSSIPLALQEKDIAIRASLAQQVFSYTVPEFLDAQEAQHMRDVKTLFDIGRILSYLALGLVLGITIVLAQRKKWPQLEELFVRAGTGAGWGVLCMCAFLGTAALLSFDRFWVLFHVLLFPQGGWLFPQNSILITLYPESFFAAFSRSVLTRAALCSALLVIVATLTHRMGREEQTFTDKHMHARKKK